MSADEAIGRVVVLPHYHRTVFGFRPGRLQDPVSGRIVLLTVELESGESHADAARRAVRSCLKMEPGRVVTLEELGPDEPGVVTLVSLRAAPWPGPLWIDVADVLEFQAPTDHPEEEFTERRFLRQAFEVLADA